MTITTPAPTIISPREWERATTTGYTGERLIPLGAPLHRQDLAEGWAVSHAVAHARRAGFHPTREDVHVVGAPIEAGDVWWWKITATWKPRVPATAVIACIGGPAAGAHTTRLHSQLPATLLAHRSKGATRFVFDPAFIPIGGPQHWKLHPYRLAGYTPDGLEAHYTHDLQEDQP
ncbi:hypothetical protein [Micrococcus sp.]|uniref:hypothetical protein n=1 Tax=Micrococcus sp. TaxID=1271 RepID=UPI002A91C311|nr:hypothetical protein [Micrococcus sp.]MDY6054368.1 hypothetical protein [Micrococcus sp.]